MSTRKMVYLAMFATLVFVATNINIYIPVGLGTGGLMHLGTLVMFVIALKYGKFYGAWAGALGMTMFDLFSIWAIWAPGTFIVRLAAGYVIGKLAHSPQGQGKVTARNFLAILAGGAIIITGYFIYEAVFLGIGLVAIASVIGNLVQIGIGLAALLVVAELPIVEDESSVISRS